MVPKLKFKGRYKGKLYIIQRVMGWNMLDKIKRDRTTIEWIRHKRGITHVLQKKLLNENGKDS